MRLTATLLRALGLILPLASANAAEKGQTLRAANLMTGPAIDSAPVAKLAAKQPITILSRKGAWMQVDSGGQTGWLRMTEVRAETGSVPAPQRASAAYRTGSRGSTATTGIKGVDEEDIRNSVPDMAQVASMDALMVGEAEAATHARQSGLRESQLAYFNDKRRK